MALEKQKENVMKMEKRTFKIGELAHHLELQQFVIRFWEKEFNFKSHRSQGGQRYYTETDLQRFERIKDMLYTQGLTIAGAKRQLNEQDAMFISSQPTTLIAAETPAPIASTTQTLPTQKCQETSEQEASLINNIDEITRVTSYVESSPEPVAPQEPAQPPSVNNEVIKARLIDVREKLQKLHTML